MAAAHVHAALAALSAVHAPRSHLIARPRRKTGAGPVSGPPGVERGGLRCAHPCKDPPLPAHHQTRGRGPARALPRCVQQSVRPSVSSHGHCRCLLCFDPVGARVRAAQPVVPGRLRAPPKRQEPGRGRGSCRKRADPGSVLVAARKPQEPGRGHVCLAALAKARTVAPGARVLPVFRRHKNPAGTVFVPKPWAKRARRGRVLGFLLICIREETYFFF